jgi:hypothetical protein
MRKIGRNLGFREMYSGLANDRFGSFATGLASRKSGHVRYAPIATKICSSAKCREVPCVDGSGLARTFFTYAGLGQCSHVFGLWVRFT